MKLLLRWLLLCVIAIATLQLYFVLRIALMAFINPQSTAFQRSEMRQVATNSSELRWRQEWLDYDRISNNLKRAVIASEDDSFSQHDGVDWEALEKAWEKNAKAQQRAESRQNFNNQNGKPSTKVKPPKVVGGSTITQQLAKNIFLSGERNLLRKGQEFIFTLTLEAFLSKKRILEIYLNNVEWGEGVFGAEAAARHYFRKSASQLSAYEAARLAVMLPRPKYFEKIPQSGYLSNRASIITGRMGDARLP